MIRQANLNVRRSLQEVWSEAHKVRQHPDEWWAKEFSHFDMVSPTTQFSKRPIPANKWFIDWGLPRKSYGGYMLVDVLPFGRTCQAKLSAALCPKCYNPIFTLLFRNRTGGYPLHTRRQCVICGYYEDVTVLRDGNLEGTIVHNGQRLEKHYGARQWEASVPKCPVS